MHSLPLDYVKIDGSLMQGLAVDQTVQEQLRVLVDAAKLKHITTIAERVEDAKHHGSAVAIGPGIHPGLLRQSAEQVTLG